MIKCNKCRYYLKYISTGECRADTPLISPTGIGVWPLVKDNDGCYRGQPKNKGQING